MGEKEIEDSSEPPKKKQPTPKTPTPSGNRRNHSPRRQSRKPAKQQIWCKYCEMSGFHEPTECPNRREYLPAPSAARRRKTPARKPSPPPRVNCNWCKGFHEPNNCPCGPPDIRKRRAGRRATRRPVPERR